MKKLIFLFAVVSILTLSACSKGFKDTSLEGVFAKDSMIVFVADASNGSQVEAFKVLAEQFPDFGLWETGVTYYDKAVEEKEELSYEKLIKPILDGRFRFGIAFSVIGEKVNLESFDQIDFKNIDFYVAAEFSEADKFEQLLNYLLAGAFKDQLKVEEKDDVKYWSSETDEVYIMRYEDLFVASASQRSLDSALVRMKEGTGFSSSDDFILKKKEAASGLGYVFVDEQFISGLLPGFYQQALGFNTEEFFETFEGMGDAFAVLGAEEDGLRSVESVKITKTDLSSLRKMGVNPEGRVHLIDKVNASGTIMYLEGFGFGQTLKEFLAGFKSYSAEWEGDKLVEDQRNLYEVVITQMSALSGLSQEKLEDLLDAPFAISIADSGSYYPTISFYLELDEQYKEDAQVLNAALNDYVAQLLKELQEIAKTEEGIELNFVSSDIEVVSGGAITKVAVDFAKLPEDLLQDEFFGKIDLNDLKLELNYGITGDNVLVFALYPNFAEVYGKNVLSADADFKEAIGRVNGKDGYMLTYFRFGSMVDIIERFVDLVSKSEQGNQEALMMYNLFSGKFFAFLETLKYIVSSSVYEDGMIKVNEFVKIEKVQK